MPEFSDPKELWLEPACAGDERCWCADKMDDCAETGCGLPAPKYIRADIVNEEIAALRAEIERLRTVIGEASQQFRWYEQLHRNKGATEKADRNKGWADRLDTALAKLSPDKPSRVGDGDTALTLFGFRVVESNDVPDDEIWMCGKTRVKIIHLLPPTLGKAV